jgi:hypothetical protein
MRREHLSKEAIHEIIKNSLFTNQSLFILSTQTKQDSMRVQDLLMKLWQQAQSEKTRVRDLSTIRLGFPWAEHPAHAFFTSIFEQRDLPEWTELLENAFREVNTLDFHMSYKDLTTNPFIATILEKIAHPGRLGTMEFLSSIPLGQHVELVTPMFRNYLLDLASPVSLRTKMGLARALTTQDRYELLRCLWQFQQGLSPDLNVQKHTRLWIYINELENILDYPPLERKTLTKGLAHLISQKGHFLTIWLNISEAETVQAVKKALVELLPYLDFDFTDNPS